MMREGEGNEMSKTKHGYSPGQEQARRAEAEQNVENEKPDYTPGREQTICWGKCGEKAAE